MSRLNWRVCSTSRIEYPIGPLNLSDTCYKNAMLRRKKSHWTKQKRKVPFQMIWARCPTAFLRSQHGVPRDRPAAAGSILSILFSYDVTTITSLDTQESCIFDQPESQPSLILPRCVLLHNPHSPQWIYKTIIRYKRNVTPCVLFLFFSNTYNSVQANANQIWKFQRYYLVMEYAQRPVLVPPFIILNHVIHLIKGIYRRLRKCCRQKTVDREDSTRSYGLSMCIVLGRPSAVSLLDLS